MTDSSKIHIATIGAPFGVRGCFRLKTHTEDPKNALNYGDLTDQKGKAYAFAFVRVENPNTLIVSSKEVLDRTAAESLRGIKLYVSKEKFPTRDETDEGYYYHALLGLKVNDTEGHFIGTVESIENYGASDILVIKTDEGLKQIAFIEDAVPEVNLDKGYLVILSSNLM